MPVQKQIEKREKDTLQIINQLDQVEKRKEREEKKWKQFKEASNRLLEEKEVLESHFKREKATIQEQKQLFDKQLEEIHSVLRANKVAAGTKFLRKKLKL